MATYYGQDNPQWANQTYGTDGNTIGDSGCAITADGNLQIAVTGNQQFTPPWIDNWLKDNSGYANGDELVWGTVANLGNVTAHGTVSTVTELNTFLQADPNYAIVQFSVGDHLHFCLANAVNTIIDSEDGKEKPLSTYAFMMAHLYTAVTKATPPAPTPAPSAAEGSFNVVTSIPGYSTATGALDRLNPFTTVAAGNYSVFNQDGGMVNVTANAGQPGAWINPADNVAPVATSSASAPDYDGNSITVQAGWGLSNAAQAAGYPDYNSPIRWAAIAALNGSSDWQTFNTSLKAGMRIVVGSYTTPVAPATPAPAPTPPAVLNTNYTKLTTPLDLITNKNPTSVWMLNFANDTEATASFDMPQGAAFIAYGKAQRTDGDRPCYYMTQADFGDADTSGSPTNNRGVNTVDLSTPPTPDYIATYEDLVNISGVPTTVTSTLESATVAIDASGQLPDKPFPAGTVVVEAGTFTHNGTKYVRSEVSKQNGTWYGYPVEAFQPQPAPPASAPALPPQPSSKSVDAIQAPIAAATPNPAGEVAAEIAQVEKRLTATQWLASIVAGAFGTVKLYFDLVFRGKGSQK